MEIEKEVPKNYFRNDRHKGLVNIIFSSNWIMLHMKHILEEDDLTPQQYNILRILQSNSKPLSTLKIRELMLDKMSDTSRIVERLLKKELVNKHPSSFDKRLVDITISEKGVILLQHLERKYEIIDGIINNLSSTELDILNTLLDKMRKQ